MTSEARHDSAGLPGGRSPVRVGGIDYLNALPLTRYLEDGGEPCIRVTSHVPSLLASKLREGGLDIALVPVVEYPASPDYRILPGMSIASYGAVESIRLFAARPVSELRAVAADASSRTSVLLLRLLLEERWGARASMASIDPRAGERLLERRARHAGREPPAGAPDAVLLIGDAALRARCPQGWESIDLGASWTAWTGLPFVYAFWVWRGGRAPAGLTRRFLEARDRGLSRIDDIVASLPPAGGIDPARARRYLHRVIQYDLGDLQMEGLREFFGRLRRLPPSPAAAGPALSMERFRFAPRWIEEPRLLPAS